MLIFIKHHVKKIQTAVTQELQILKDSHLDAVKDAMSLLLEEHMDIDKAVQQKRPSVDSSSAELLEPDLAAADAETLQKPCKEPSRGEREAAGRQSRERPEVSPRSPQAPSES